MKYRREVTKKELRRKLRKGLSLDEVLRFSEGERCDIFKIHEFPKKGNAVVYIPDYYHCGIEGDKKNLSKDEIKNVLSWCYTRRDFMHEAFDNIKAAEDLWNITNWQNPDITDLQECTSEKEAKHDYGETWMEMWARTVTKETAINRREEKEHRRKKPPKRPRGFLVGTKHYYTKDGEKCHRECGYGCDALFYLCDGTPDDTPCGRWYYYRDSDGSEIKGKEVYEEWKKPSRKRKY